MAVKLVSTLLPSSCFPASVSDFTPTANLSPREPPMCVIWLGKGWTVALLMTRALWGRWHFVFSFSQVPSIPSQWVLLAK